MKSLCSFNSSPLVTILVHLLFNNDVIMSSLVSTGNCKLGHDSRLTTAADTTQLDSFVASASAVCIEHSGSGVIVLTDRQTDKQSQPQTDTTESNTTLAARAVTW